MYEKNYPTIHLCKSEKHNLHNLVSSKSIMVITENINDKDKGFNDLKFSSSWYICSLSMCTIVLIPLSTISIHYRLFVAFIDFEILT